MKDQPDYFRDFMLNEGCSPDTVRTYSYVVNRFKKFYKKDIKNATRDHVIEFLTKLRNEELSPSTRRLIICGLRYYYSDYLVNDNVMRKIKAPKVQRVVKDWLSEDEIKKLIKACDKIDDRVLILVLYTICPRISELQDIRRNDVNFKSKKITIERRKKRGEFNISDMHMDDDTLAEIKTYINGRNDSNKWLFRGNEGKVMSKKTIRRRLKRICKIAGVKGITPHQLRHSRASVLRNTYGVELDIIQALLGHADISTTKIYADLTPERLREELPVFKWR